MELQLAVQRRMESVEGFSLSLQPLSFTAGPVPLLGSWAMSWPPVPARAPASPPAVQESSLQSSGCGQGLTPAHIAYPFSGPASLFTASLCVILTVWNYKSVYID